VDRQALSFCVSFRKRLVISLRSGTRRELAEHATCYSLRRSFTTRMLAPTELPVPAARNSAIARPFAARYPATLSRDNARASQAGSLYDWPEWIYTGPARLLLQRCVLS
jgi:hypothetical protein